MLIGGGAARPGIGFERNSSGPQDPADLARGEIEAELARLLGSDKISRNVNSARFLRYVVEEALEGRGERLKAFSIATQALGRSDDFDPQSDSIVRVQAVRVRAQLEDYYTGPGAGDPVRITLPKGSYVPRFECPLTPRPVETEPEAPAAVPVPAPRPVEPDRASGYGLLARVGLFVMGVTVMALVAFELLWKPGGPSAVSGAPALEIGAQGAPAEGPLRSVADRMVALMTTDATGGEDVRIQRAGGTGAAGGDYALEAHFAPVGAHLFDVDFVLTERRNREVVWSRSYADVDLDDRARQESLAHHVAAVTVDMGGVLLSDLYRRLHQTGPPLTGVYCRLTALNYLLVRNEEGRPAARDCLERQIAREPDDLRSLALLSSFLVVGYLEDFSDSRGEIDVQRALQLSRRAYELKPGGLVAMAALFYARFAEHRYEDAFGFAPLLMEKNPNSLLVMLRLGRAFVSRGRYEEGCAELQRMETRFGAPQPAATAYLGLAALMRDDRAGLERYATRVVSDVSPLGLLLAMIEARQRNDLARLEAKREKLKAQFPRFYADFPGAFRRYGFASPIVERLTTELAALGVGEAFDRPSP